MTTQASDLAHLQLARQVCAERAEAEGKTHTAECYRSGAWDEHAEMPLALAIVQWMSDRGTRCSWPISAAELQSCRAEAVVNMTLSAFANNLPPAEQDLANAIDSVRERLTGAILDGLGIQPDARAS